MVDVPTAVALGLLILGVVGSVIPGLPGALFSLVGILVYAWSTGFTDPSLPVLLIFVALGIFAAVVDYFGGAIGAGMGGASRQTIVVAVLVSVALFFVTGPAGALIGLAVTVFGLEFRRAGDAKASGRAALYAVVGVLGSAVIQLLLTGTMLVAFLVVILW